jgi:hypothetical protein
MTAAMKVLTMFAQIAGVAQGAQVRCGPRTIPVHLEKQDGRLYFKDPSLNQYVLAESSSWKVEVFEKGVMLNNGTEPGTYRMQNGTVDLSMSPLVDLCRRDLEMLKKGRDSSEEFSSKNNGTTTTADSFAESGDQSGKTTLAQFIGSWLDYFGVFGDHHDNKVLNMDLENNNNNSTMKGDSAPREENITVTPKLYFKVNITEEEKNQQQVEF